MSPPTQERHRPAAVDVGGGAPIDVPSMTNTDTADVAGTARQLATQRAIEDA